MNQKNGFTLVEMLFILMIISIFIVLFIPSTMRIIENQQTNHFFELLNSDIVMIQNQSLGIPKNIRIIFDKDHYIIMNEHELLAQREYPTHLSYVTRSNNRITFNNTGTVINPRKYQFHDRHTSYEIIFPLGKGRHYIEES